MWELFINGLCRGAVYALVALGYTMIYGILGMINFAHGEIFMIGMFAAVYGIGVFTTVWGPSVGINLILATLFAMVIAGGFGFANERIAYRKLRHAHKLAPLTSAIGLSIVLQNFIMLSVSKDQVLFPKFDSAPFIQNKIDCGIFQVSWLQAGILGATALMMVLLFYFIQRTRWGIAMRAVAQDQRMASLVGISVDRMIAFTFVLGSVLAAVAGVMVGAYQGVMRFDSGYLLGLKAFTAAVLGGIGNIPGAVLGGILIGLTEDGTSYFLGSDWKNITIFVILMTVLILRPRGLLGERVSEKV